MKRYFGIFHIALSVSVVFFFSSCKKNLKDIDNTTNEPKPNIIFIVGDDVGYEVPAVNGGISYSTPNIDKLAQNGMRFTQCRSAPLCSPSRFMLLTGKYNFRNYTTWGVMDQGQRTSANMLKDAGYATCYAGKWQLDGGDQSIHTFGFDKYSVWLPFKVCPEEAEGSRYKSAKIYEKGAYLPDSETLNKYSEDHFADYLLNFIDSNSSKPFFVYYAMILSHTAFSPTPDDPEYATWDSNPYNSDTAFFPSMVKYMDKKIGLLIDKLKTLGIENNTIIFYVGDNGTQREITSLFKNKSIRGAKGQTIEYGIHVPLLCKWTGKVAAATINNDLVDFTDFLPTLADMANIPKPVNYGILDGTSFYPQLKGSQGNTRNSMFTYYNPNICEGNEPIQRYSQDSIYKLYETGAFYKFANDLFEKKPLPDSSLTLEQKQIKQNLQNVLNMMHN
jgi:arylsulfatase A